MRALFALVLLLPSTLLADGHISIGVACKGPIPIGIEVRMTKPDVVQIPILALVRWCESEYGKPI